MPITDVLFYRDDRGRAPVVEWLQALRKTDPRAYARCAAVIERLAEAGFELRRPTADMLRDGIHELRAKSGRVHYRILYFFHGRNVAILAHGLTKEGKVPPDHIDLAIRRRQAFEADPAKHTYRE